LQLIAHLIPDFVDGLIDGDSELNSATAETNAVGWSHDSSDVLEVHDEQDGITYRVRFEAHVQISGDHDHESDRPWSGDVITCTLKGVAECHDGTNWEIIEHSIADLTSNLHDDDPDDSVGMSE